MKTSRYLYSLCHLAWMLLLPLLALSQGKKKSLESISIPKSVLLDKIKGGWAGQTIGVTYGWPTEFLYQGTFIQDYESIPWNDDYINQAMEAFPGLYDDIYVDLTFMEVFERVGLEAPIDSFAAAFARTEYELWHANQVARYNLRNGVPPAQAGHWLNNPHADDIDFQIEADFAGLMSPAMPQAASTICAKTGTMIASGDGYYGGVFVANMYAQAFHRNDIKAVILEALAAIPPESKFFQCIEDVVRWHKEYPADWKQTWWKIQQIWAEDIGCPNFVFHPINIDAKVNAAYVVMALLYGGGDFFKTMDIATRAGQDSDCNPATACGVLGTMIGYNQIPPEYLDPLKRAEDKKFSHSAYSLQDVYQLNLELAYANIEKHGGKVTASEVRIPLQKTLVAAMEENFAGHFPAERVKVARATDGSFDFDFQGKGVVLSGYVTKKEAGLPDTTLQAALYVDGQLVETANLYTHSIDRRPELFWRFQLSDEKHRVEVKLLSPDQRYGLYIADYLVYRSSPKDLKQAKPPKHAMIVIGDPQVYKMRDVDSVRVYMEDIRQYTQNELKGYAVHGMVTGDMTGDQPQLLQALSEVFSETGIPFHYVKGNHDMAFGVHSNEGAAVEFEEHFGPTYYSFNVGDVHYVVLDNVFYLGHGHEYVGYLPEAQLRWLEQDLQAVPAGGTVVVSLHIPTSHKSFRKANQQQVMRNASHLYELLKPYKAHIISGHTHLQDRHQPAPHIREHTQASLSGIFWQGPDCADGTPAGYSVFLWDDDTFSWRYKSIGKPDSHQFRAYAVGENPERPDDLTVLVWNADPNWTVRWYEDGVYKGLMTNYIGRDPQTTKEIIASKASYDYDWIWTTETDHLFYARPENSGSEISIEVEDEFGNVFKEDVQRPDVKARVTMDNYLIPLNKRGAVVGTVLSDPSTTARVTLISDTAGLFRIDKHGTISLRKKMKLVAGGVHAFGITLAVGDMPYELELVKDEFLRNKVVAHRGAWRKTGVMQNSIRSFQHAVALACEASEFDVWLSKDKEVVLSHDPHIGGLTVEEATARELYASTLASGDPVPTLKDLINLAKLQNKTKMILEIKPSPTGRNPELVDSVLSIVHRLKAQAYIEYISFDYGVLKRIRSQDPAANTAYLSGDKTVDELEADGITGLDYDFYKYQADPELLEKAKERGLTTNVWTVNEEDALRAFLRSGVDRITTDEPELLMSIIRKEN